jgi:hypothetical protein
MSTRPSRSNRVDGNRAQCVAWLEERGYVVVPINGTWDDLVGNPRKDRWLLVEWKLPGATFRASQVHGLMETLRRWPRVPLCFAETASEVEEALKRA